MLAQLQVDSADTGWAAQLRTVARYYPQLARPHVMPLTVTRPQATPLTQLKADSADPGRVPARPHPQFQELTGNPDKTGDLPRLGCTGCRPARSPCCAASPPSSPATTAPPNPNADPASSWPGSHDTDSRGK